MTPEQKAREKIDAMLTASGWVIQNYKEFNPSVGRGIALREVPLKSGRCDYLLLVERKAVGVVEAKREEHGKNLSVVADQSGTYGGNLPDFLKTSELLPFYYESTGVETLFRDERDPEPRSRRVFSFHRPETLASLLEDQTTLRARLAQMPFANPLATTGMRDCQVEGITNLEKSFAADQPRALIQMATGAGKTYTACAFTYGLIRHAGAKRVLFLVDRANLGRQAKSEFDQFVTVTVDMIATGADIKPLECLLFLRDVRSRVYFEQMKGRGTRVLTPTDLQAVSGEQTRIVAEVERRLSVVEELESVVTANLQRATRLRQSILQKAFTGNL